MEEEQAPVPSGIAPFLVDKQPIGNYELSNQLFDLAEDQKEKPAFLDTARARFPGNAIYRKFMSVRDELLTLSELNNDPDNPFDFWQEQYMSQLSPEYWPEAYNNCKTEGQFFRKVAEIGQREEYRKSREEAGTMSLIGADAASGLVNPLYWIPAAHGLRSLEFLPVAKHLLTKSIPSGMIGTGIDNADLYFNHQMLSGQEAIADTLFAGVFTGIFGGAGAALRAGKLNVYKKLMEEGFKGNTVKFWLNESDRTVKGFSITDDSVGSASTRHLSLEGESLYGWGKDGKLRVGNLPIYLSARLFQNPVTRGLISKSPRVRTFINEMLDHNMDITKVEKSLDVVPEALQRKIYDRQSQTFNFNVEMMNGYYKYLGIDPSKGFESKIVLGKLKQLTAEEKPWKYEQFSKEVYLATVQGGKHDNAAVSEMSNKFIDKYLNPIYDELVDLKLLPPNLTPSMAAQHVMRVYDRPYITGNEHKIRKFLTEKFTETNDKLKALKQPIHDLEFQINRIKEDMKGLKSADKSKANKEIERLTKQKEYYENGINERIKKGEYADDLTPDMVVGDKELKLRSIREHEDLEAAAQEAIDTILGLNEEQMNEAISGFMQSGSSGTDPLKRRTLMISDVELINMGMLNSDIRTAFGAYNIRMSRLIEMEKYLRSQGYNGEGPRLGFLTSEIREDYRRLSYDLDNRYNKSIEGKEGKPLEKVEKKFQKERLKLEKSLRRDLETVSTVYKRLMGQTGVNYGKFLRYTNAAKKWLYSTELGALSLLQLQEFAAPAFHQGMKRYFGNGVIPFIRNTIAMDKKFGDSVKSQLQDIGLGIETLQAYLNMGFAFDRDALVPHTFGERLADNMANAMGIANLSNGMSDKAQFLAGMASMSGIIKDIRKFQMGNLGERDLKRLLYLGVDPSSDVAKRMLKLAEEKGTWRRGAVNPNWTQWDISDKLSREAKNLIRSAVKKNVRSTLFSGSNMGSFPVGGEPNGMLGAFIMYMGWGLNAVSNFTIPLFQRFDTDRISTALLMMTISSVVDPLRKIASGREVTDEDLEIGTLFKQGVLNSGILGTFSDVFNKMNEMGDVFPGLRADRFRNTRGMISFGPERMVSDMLNLIGMVANNEYNKKDIKRLIKNLGPMGNVLWMRRLVNQWLDSLDLPDTRAKAERLKEWR